MSKRVIEFNCGDPKSNQQTASKVDCQITINNNQSGGAQSDGNRRVGSRGVKCVDGIEVFVDDSDQGADVEVQADQTPQISASASTGDFNTRVNIPVKPVARSIPTSSERFVVVSRQPVILSESISENVAFLKKINDILVHLLTQDDKKLLVQLIDQSGKIILTGEDLCEVIVAAYTAAGQTITKEQISIAYQDQIISSCLKIQISPFKRIMSIKVDGQDFTSFQHEAASFITEECKISLTDVYIQPGTKL